MTTPYYEDGGVTVWHGDDLWFPPENARQSARMAYRVCASCPVLAQCREWGLSDDGPEFGILGGLSARARQRLRVRAQRQEAA